MPCCTLCRFFPILHKIIEMCKPWGIIVMSETAAEAAMTCKNNDTDPEGLNYAGEYVTETGFDEGWMFADGAPDPGNGHLPGH